VGASAALSMANTPKNSIRTRKIAALVADGFDEAGLEAMKKALTAGGAVLKTVAPRLGVVTGANGAQINADFSLLTTSSVLFDALYVAGGETSAATLAGQADALHFVNESYKHCKAIAATGAGIDVLVASYLGHEGIVNPMPANGPAVAKDGVVVSGNGQAGKAAALFVGAIAEHRHWVRETKGQVPA
jgi:catalase